MTLDYITAAFWPPKPLICHSETDIGAIAASLASGFYTSLTVKKNMDTICLVLFYPQFWAEKKERLFLSPEIYSETVPINLVSQPIPMA